MMVMNVCLRLLAVSLLGTAALVSPPLHAQPVDLPPPLPAGEADVIRPKVVPAPGLAAPIADDVSIADLPPARKVAPETRIDQRRVGNRVVEITVTPAGSTRSYTVQNREGQRPLSVHELSSGLSVPNFFKHDF
jgi:hypothetical protein